MTTIGRPAHFGRELFDFLRDLRANNDRTWFQANRGRYEHAVRDPFLRFIADFGPQLERISRHFVADPRPSGGSLFRIHRDTRFSKDKSPYKTAAAAQFRHERGKDVHAPGFYLHLEPDGVFAGSGLWHPDREALARIRAAIVEQPERWERAIHAPGLGAALTLHGDKLKRPPAGYAPDHPLIEHLKLKDFVVSTSFSEDEACRPEFIDRFAESCRAAAPLMEFLTAAVGLPW